jgi:hypothetical protein
MKRIGSTRNLALLKGINCYKVKKRFYIWEILWHDRERADHTQCNLRLYEYYMSKITIFFISFKLKNLMRYCFFVNCDFSN